MKRLGQRYVQYVNRTYRRSGTLWERRLRSCVDGFRNARVFGEQCGESPTRVVKSGHGGWGKAEGCEVGSGSQGGDGLSGIG